MTGLPVFVTDRVGHFATGSIPIKKTRIIKIKTFSCAAGIERIKIYLGS
jgi:hypothetical protein